jgi:putative DNA primase/helicase
MTIETNLTPNDMKMFEDLRIPAELVAAAGIERVTDQEAREKFGITGQGDMSGLVFPYFIPGKGDHRSTCRLRRDHPEIQSGQPRNKYLSPHGDNRHLYFPPNALELLANQDAEIIFVEAEKSALALLAWSRRKGRALLPVATGGCWGWRGRIGKIEDASGKRVDQTGHLPDLSCVKGRKVYILFDANAATNLSVQVGRQQFEHALYKLGAARVVTLNLPSGDWNGPDDYIAAAGDDAMQEVFTKASSADSWPEPIPLEPALPPVQPLPLEYLPRALRPLIQDTAERMQVPADYPAANTIVALGGCVNRRAIIQPKREDFSWKVVPKLWGGIVGPPGFLKSPVTRAVTSPVVHIEEIWCEEHRLAAEDYEVAMEQAELRDQAWKEQCKQAFKKNADPPLRPDKSLVRPTEKRLLLMHATFEKLHEILSENPAGVMILRDELTGWFADLEKPGRESERAFYLQAWNGDSGFTVDRIGRGSVHVPFVCVSLLGNIQPARLRTYLADTLAGGPSDDGLLQRFQILVWPDAPPDWKLVDRPPNGEAIATAERVFSVLANLPADSPISMRFADDAQALFYAWLEELEHRVRGDSLPPVLVSHLAKYRSLMPSLAGLFELADLVAAGGEVSEQVLISLEHTQQAAAFCDYLESHAKRVYSCTLSPERSAAIALLGHLKKGTLPETFTTRQVYQKGWSSLDTPEDARRALGVLERHLWIERADTQPMPVGGRPTEAWVCNPRMVRDAK